MGIGQRLTDGLLSAWDTLVTRGDPRQMSRRHAHRLHRRRLARDKDYAAKYQFGRELAAAMIRARGYRNAKSGDKGPTGPWVGGGSADTHARDHQTLSDRALELRRDDPLVDGIVRRFQRNVVGQQIRPQARTGSDAVNALLESQWHARADRLDPVDQLPMGDWQAMVFGLAFTTGDTLIRPVIHDDAPHVQFEVIEADRIQARPGARPQDPQGRIVDGVERDRWGRRVAYHVTAVHPRDATRGLTRDDYQRRPADEFIHLGRIDRPGQSRAVTELHAVIGDLRDLDFLLQAGLKRLQIATSLAAFIKSGYGIEDLLGEEGVSEDLATETENILKTVIEPGTIYRLEPGEEVQTLLPNFPSPELYPFIKTIAMRIGAALGITWEEILANYSEDNYSSARTGLLDSRTTYVFLQRWFSVRVLTPMWVRLHENLRLDDPQRYDGVLPEMLRAVRWIAPGWAWVDPQKEVGADVDAYEAGHTTLQEIYARRGLFWEDEVSQGVKERAYLVRTAYQEARKLETDLDIEVDWHELLPPTWAGRPAPVVQPPADGDETDSKARQAAREAA